MPSTTPNFALPYPSPSDEPCDFAEQWCDFTAAIDGIFGTFEAGIARTVPTVPLAILRCTVQQPVPNLQLIPFDAVSADTASMTDINSYPYGITATRFGRYTVSGGLELGSSGLVNNQTTMSIRTPAVSVSAGALDRGNSFIYRMNAFAPALTLNPGDKVEMTFNVGVDMNVTVFAAWLAVYWHADREVP